MPHYDFYFRFSGKTLKAWRYACEIPERLKLKYGYPRGHRFYIKCTPWRQVQDLVGPVLVK